MVGAVQGLTGVRAPNGGGRVHIWGAVRAIMAIIDPFSQY